MGRQALTAGGARVPYVTINQLIGICLVSPPAMVNQLIDEDAFPAESQRRSWSRVHPRGQPGNRGQRAGSRARSPPGVALFGWNGGRIGSVPLGVALFGRNGASDRVRVAPTLHCPDATARRTVSGQFWRCVVRSQRRAGPGQCRSGASHCGANGGLTNRWSFGSAAIAARSAASSVTSNARRLSRWLALRAAFGIAATWS